MAATATDPATVQTYKTCVFRIHNPSHRKRAMLDDALRRNHLAYSKALRSLLPRLEGYAALGRLDREWTIRKDIGRILAPLPLSSGAKASIIVDLHGQLAGYLELRRHQDNCPPPNDRTLDNRAAAAKDALDQLRSAVDLPQEDAARSRLLEQQKAGGPRPLHFLRNTRQDGYLILYNPEKDTYAVWLNLHSKKSRFAEQVRVEGMINIRTGEPERTINSSTGAIFPVEFGADFQLAEYIKKAKPQSALLRKTEDGFYDVHVTFLFEAPRVETSTILGVGRGISNLCCLCIIDGDGRIIDRQSIDGRSLRFVQLVHERRQRKGQEEVARYSANSRHAMADEAVHVTANRIADMAARHSAQVVMEDLSKLPDLAGKRRRTNFDRVLNRSQYARLVEVLSYKLSVLGLPAPRKVYAGGSSQTCPQCGSWSHESLTKGPAPDGFDTWRFACLACGFEDDGDLNTARIIGEKRIWRDALPARFRTVNWKDIPDEHSFGYSLRDRAERRGDGPDTFGGQHLDRGRTNDRGLARE